MKTDTIDYSFNLSNHQLNLIQQSLRLAEQHKLITPEEKHRTFVYLKQSVVDEDTVQLIKRCLHNDVAVLRINKSCLLEQNRNNKTLGEYYTKREKLIFEIFLSL
jgi:hypothetical protein